jgi:hypothetical protein
MTKASWGKEAANLRWYSGIIWFCACQQDREGGGFNVQGHFDFGWTVAGRLCHCERPRPRCCYEGMGRSHLGGLARLGKRGPPLIMLRHGANSKAARSRGFARVKYLAGSFTFLRPLRRSNPADRARSSKAAPG